MSAICDDLKFILHPIDVGGGDELLGSRRAVPPSRHCAYPDPTLRRCHRGDKQACGRLALVQQLPLRKLECERHRPLLPLTGKIRGRHSVDGLSRYIIAVRPDHRLAHTALALTESSSRLVARSSPDPGTYSIPTRSSQALTADAGMLVASGSSVPTKLSARGA